MAGVGSVAEAEEATRRGAGRGREDRVAVDDGDLEAGAFLVVGWRWR